MAVRSRKAKAADGQGIWRKMYLDLAAGEGRKILTEAQYVHVLEQIDDLATEKDPAMSHRHDVRPIEGYYELRMKGGILGKINLRVYFALVTGKVVLLVLACYKKEEEGQTPAYIRARVNNRLRAVLPLV